MDKFIRVVLDDSKDFQIAAHISHKPGMQKSVHSDVSELLYDAQQSSMFPRHFILMPDKEIPLKQFYLLCSNIETDYITIFDKLKNHKRYDIYLYHVDHINETYQICMIEDVLRRKNISYDSAMAESLMVVLDQNVLSIIASLESIPDYSTLDYNNISSYFPELSSATPYELLRCFLWEPDLKRLTYLIDQLKDAMYLLFYLRKVFLNALIKRNATFNKLGQDEAKRMYRITHLCKDTRELIPSLYIAFDRIHNL